MRPRAPSMNATPTPLFFGGLGGASSFLIITSCLLISTPGAISVGRAVFAPPLHRGCCSFQLPRVYKSLFLLYPSTFSIYPLLPFYDPAEEESRFGGSRSLWSYAICFFESAVFYFLPPTSARPRFHSNYFYSTFSSLSPSPPPILLPFFTLHFFTS